MTLMRMRLPAGRWYLLCSDPAVRRDEPGRGVLGVRHGAAAGFRGGVVLASVVLLLVHPLLDAADGGGG